MNKKDFNARVARLGDAVRDIEVKGLESVNVLFGHKFMDSLHYSGACEMMFKKYLEGVGKEKKWTWYGDLSIAEWYIRMQKNSVIKTCQNALKYWADDEKCMAEFSCSVAMKATEHYERKNFYWAEYYTLLYERIVNILYDYYEGDKEKTSYLWEYLD